MSFFVRFWGTRGSIPTPGQPTKKYGGNTSCVEIRVDDQLFICDAGTGLRELGEALAQRGEAPIVGHMFFSHTHWDHIQGFPFFSLRTAPKTDSTFGVPKAKAKTSTACFQDRCDPSTSLFPLANSVPRLSLKSCLQREPPLGMRPSDSSGASGRLLGILLSEVEKVVYATDHELDGRILNSKESQADPEVSGQISRSSCELRRGADLLIADAQYTELEYLDSRLGTRALTTVDLAVQAEVDTLPLFHHDPMQSDRQVDLKVDSCRKRAKRLAPKLTAFGAREGIELPIG